MYLADIGWSFDVNGGHVDEAFTMTNTLQHSAVSKHQLTIYAIITRKCADGRYVAVCGAIAIAV